MTRDQKVVAIGAASGVATMIAAVTGIYQLWPSSLAFADLSSRLAYALEANAFAVLPLLAGIITVGNDRFVSEAIDPTLRKEDRATQINGRVVENTLQQFVLFFVATMALSVNLSSESDSIFMPMISGSCQAAGKDANASKEHPGLRAGDCFLKVFRQTSAAIEPSKGSFEHTALWLSFKCTDTFRSCNDLDKPLAELCERLV